MSNSKKNQSTENAKGALQGAAEGAMSSTGSQTQGGEAKRAAEDVKKVKKLSDNVKSGDLQRGVQNKAKQMAEDRIKHPVKSTLNPTSGLDKEDSKNIAKGAVQYATGDARGLSETVADEANHISEGGKDDKSGKSDKHSLSDTKSKSDKGGLGSLGKSDDKDDDSKKDKKKEKDENEEDDKKKKRDDEEEINAKKVAKTAKTASAGTAAAIKGALALQLASFMKMMLSLLMAAAQAIAAAIATVVAAVVHAAAAIAVALGVSVAVAVGGIFGIVAVGVVAVVSFLIASNDDTAAAREGYIDDESDPCAAAETDTYNTIEFDGDVVEIEKKIYSFFHEYGYSDEQIAGLLGCWLAESGSSLDFSAIEGIYDEPYQIGAKKQAALDDIDSYTRNTLLPMYGWTTSDHPGYLCSAEFGNIASCGIGLGQCTADRGQKLLAYGEAAEDYEWYDVECQLAFYISEDGTASSPKYYAQWLADWVGVDYGNPEAACKDFANGSGGGGTNGGWEGHTPDDPRIPNAQSVYLAISSGWEVDTAVYDTVIEIAGDTAILGSGSNTNSDGSEKNKCDNGVSYGDDLADRMSAYCWDTKDESISDYTAAGGGDDPCGIECGTELYKKVHAAIAPDDNYWASCDRGVAFAVKWSGCDDAFPLGDPGDQGTHMLEQSDKWENVTAQISTLDDLQPGDILLHASALDGNYNSDGTESNHIIMYLGKEVVQKYHPDVTDESQVFGSASFGDRPPNIGAEDSNFMATYTYVFRNIKKDTDSAYKDIDVD